MKHLLKLTLLLLTILFPDTASAYDFEVDGIYYNVNGNEVTVTYQGNSTNSYTEKYSGDVTIPATVTSLDGTTYIVTSIGNHAFSDCFGLTSVTIPNSVTSISNYAFNKCSGLTSVTIPNSVTSIGYYAFSGCSGLTSVTIPNSVSSISYGSFSGCSGLTAVTIPNSITSISNYAFNKCSGLTSVTIPNSVTSIGDYAFSGCSGLTSVTIPNSVSSISYGSFSGCSGLAAVTIPNSITSISNDAFKGCSCLTSVTIPNSVTSIGYGAFSECDGLISLTVESGNPKYDSRNNCNAIIETSTNSLIVGCANTTIPNSVASIGDVAFSGCSGLVRITIPNSVTSIGYGAFSECDGLISLTVESGNPKYDSRNNCNAIIETSTNTLIVGCANTTIPNSVASIGDVAFSGCSGLVRITIPNSVTSIGYGAFSECDGLISLTVESGNPKYDSRNNCNAIIETSTNTLIAGCTNTTIPNSVTSIGNYAFYCCNGLTSIIIPNSTITISDGAFYNCSGLTSMTIGNSVLTIGESAFYGCSGLTSITIPNSVITIGYEAFRDCSGITSVTIGNSVAEISNSAFSGCTALDTLNFNALSCDDFHLLDMMDDFGLVFYGTNISTINIGDGVQKIPASFAYELTKLSSITIPSSITSIGYNAFLSCTGLTRVNIIDLIEWCSIDFNNSFANPLFWAHHLYINNSEVSNLIIPYSISSISKFAFCGCSGLTSVIIPNSVTLIGESAFNGCSGLTSVTIPNTITSIGDEAFAECNTLKDVYSYITDLSKVMGGDSMFEIWTKDGDYDYSTRTLHVPIGSLAAYQADNRWSDYFGSIVEMGPMVATSIELNSSTAMLEPGETLQLTAELQPIEAMYNEVLWGSSNPEVATVSNDGLVTAVNVGTATITAMTAEGSNLSASCIVTVYTEMSGDVDANGDVNISDVTALIDYLLSGDSSAIILTNADCDGNGNVNISDVTELIDYLLTGHWQEELEPTLEVTSYTVNGVTFKMVTVDGDSFTMGATDEQGSDFNANERPVHQVTLSDYKIGQTEVTQELWQAVMGSNPSNFTGDLQRPVDKVSWNDCQEFISKLNQLTGKSFRLPSEAEWEFAARGGKLSQGFKYAGSNTVDDVAWYKDNSESMTHPVATKAPNELGLYDMSGNVFEWCQDWFGNYSGDAQTNPMGPTSGSYRSCRGGGWNYNDKYCRVSYRSYHSMTSRYDRIGLRLALDPNEIETPSDDEEFVDLGLPSGILWATKNIGAQSPEDFGEYFDLDLEWCLDWWANRQSSNIANESNLSWNWPTKGDLEELVKECTWEWTMYNNVNGYQVTGPNGNSLFLPAAGCYYYENLDTPVGVGSDCDYWSETISYVPKGGNCAYIACLNADRYEYAVTIDVNFNKQPVRPVLRNYK